MTTRSWIGLVYIGTSVDGMIARADGTLDWLTARGAAAGDAGYEKFIARVDTILIGRGTYEAVLAFDGWAYQGKRVLVLSSTLDPDADDRITVVRDLTAAQKVLVETGARGVYIDGGQTIQACLNAGLIDELTISHVPVLIGDGRRLFGSLTDDIDLRHISTSILGGGMVQTTYTTTLVKGTS